MQSTQQQREIRQNCLVEFKNNRSNENKLLPIKASADFVMCVTHLCDTTASEAKEVVDMEETVQGIVCFKKKCSV